MVLFLLSDTIKCVRSLVLMFILFLRACAVVFSWGFNDKIPSAAAAAAALAPVLVCAVHFFLRMIKKCGERTFIYCFMEPRIKVLE